MNSRQYLRKRDEIEAECRKKIEALDTVFRMYDGDPDAAVKARAKMMGAPGAATGKGALRNAIRQVLPMMVGPFTSDKIWKKLRENSPELNAKPASVSSALLRMADGVGLELVERGKGKRPSQYCVPAGEKGSRLKVVTA